MAGVLVGRYGAAGEGGEGETPSEVDAMDLVAALLAAEVVSAGRLDRVGKDFGGRVRAGLRLARAARRAGAA